MSKLIFIIAAIAFVAIGACNNNNEPSTETNQSQTDSSGKMTTDTTKIVEVTHRFNDVNTQFAASLNEVIDGYLQIKNALVNDNGSDAADGGKAMNKALNKVDKSVLTADQNKLYAGIEDDLKEHAEHIGENAGKIEHQREHFSMMSEDMYDLVKAFGGGRPLYHDHCPMANDNKGAMWLNETKDVKNPYFGGKMNECVKVPEVIK